jgi:hypothetical protein
MPDSPRLLHRRSELAYTETPLLALSDEPEAVSRSEQERLTREAAAQRQAERRRFWLYARDHLLAELVQLQEILGPAVLPEVRTMRREIDRVGRKV